MRTSWHRIVLRGLIAFAVFVVLLSALAHPWFAVTRTSGGRVLVAEGWMHEEGLRETARLFREGGYERLCLTGTVRPFAYYLLKDDSIHFVLRAPASGQVLLGVGGLPGAEWTLWLDGRMVLRGVAEGAVKEHRVNVPSPGFSSGALVFTAPAAPGPEVPVGFVARFTVEGTNVHELVGQVTIHQGDGSQREGQPTYAEQGRDRLVRDGIPYDQITAVPTIEVEGSRTWSSARSFTDFARSAGIDRFDVATLGVHARRSWKMYRKAWGTNAGVGIVSLNDPWCRRWSWWTNYYGWYQMTKELVALPAPYLVSGPEGDDAP
ncbi:MAG TPA: hypothetical protein PLN54_16355 [Flavobacteriales bacterium]|nr:hypothetical protein [Flavobacteriales bacterium]